MEELNLISGRIVDAAYRIHKELGPGLLESVYETILARDLARLGYRIERQKPISVEFEGLTFPNACRADLVVEGSVVVEVKSVENLPRVHQKQLITYLRLLDLRLGLLLNFGRPLMKDGIHRLINGWGDAEANREPQFDHTEPQRSQSTPAKSVE